MFKRKTKVSFKRVLEVMKSIDSTCGVYLLRDPTKKKTLKEYIFQTTLPRTLFCFTFITTSTLIVTNFQLLSFIIGFSVGLTIFGLSASLIIFIFNGDIVRNLIKWCESIYDMEKKYHKSIHTMAENKLIKIENQSTKVLKWFRRIYYFDGTSFTLGFAILGIFLPENIYPKYSPPVPFYLPFENQQSWMSFTCTTLFVTLVAVDVASISLYIFGLMICLSFHILAYMDFIQETVEKMKQDLITNTKVFDVKPKETKKKYLNVDTLAYVNASLTKKDPKVSFDDWIKILHEMICEVNFIILSAAKLYAFPNLFNELAALGSLFVCGFLLSVLRDQQLFGIGITIICGLLYMVCFINEKILEKFENINNALYDMPWYNLTACQQKKLMMLMHCDKIQKGLAAASLHTVTFERFGLIIKAGYTNFLVLKDLVNF